MRNSMRIVLSGGGTMGSVTPLLALVDELRRQGGHEFLWLGTRGGNERVLVEEWGIKFKPIFSGKFRRYFSWQNFTDIFRLKLGFWQAIFILKKFKVDRVLTAGGFVAVPVVLAARFLKIPVLVHQQDLKWGLANQLMRPLATWITVNYSPTLEELPERFRERGHLVGNPVRHQISEIITKPGDRDVFFKKFNLEPNLLVLLVLGGGTGALRLNQIITEAMPGLSKFCQVLHLTGKDKKVKVPPGEWEARYHWQEFLIKEMPDVYQVADLVISRAGTGTLTELSILGKPTIIVPIPQSHQEANAKYFADALAAVVLDQTTLLPQTLVEMARGLLSNQAKREFLSVNIKKLANPEAAKEMIKLIE